MGNFTVALKTVHEMESGNVGLDDYPIFEELYRESLNQKILDHYWNQEIGQESISMFRFALKRKMNEIMPLYNEHYKLSLLELDPLSTVNIKNMVEAVTATTDESTSNEAVTGHSANTSTSGAQARAVASDTPQTALQVDADYATSMQDTNSASTASGEADDTRNSESTGAANSSGTSETEQQTTGYSGHAPMLILQARQALVNIDMMIINELQDLFMLIWSTNDSYTERNYPYYGFFR